MSVLTRKAIADVTRRKGRTLLAIVGILIGVLGLTAVNQASDLLGGTFFYSTDAQALPNITFTVDRLPAAVALAIQHLPNEEKMQLRETYNTFWFFQGDHETIEIDAYQDVQRAQVGTFQVTSGREPGRGEIVMDESDQGVAAVALGDRVVVAAPDGHRVPLRVVGLARTQGLAVWHWPLAPAIGYMSPDALQQLTGETSGPIVNAKPRGTEILVRTHDPNSVRQTYAAIAQVLDGAHLVTASSRDHDASFDADVQLAVAGPLIVIRLLAFLALLLVCVMFFNSVSTLLTEQLTFIGTMKALGGTRWRIVRSYQLTIGIYSLVGTALGIELGLLAGYQLATHLASLVQEGVGPFSVTVDVGPFSISWWVPLTSAAVGIFVPQLAALTLLALTLSGTIFLAVQITTDTLGSQIIAIPHADVRVDLASAGVTVPAAQVIRAIQSLPNVEQVEPIDPAIISIAQRELELIGLRADTQFYQPHLVAGRWLLAHEQGALVINDFAAQQLHLQVGEQVIVHLEAQQPQQMTWTIVGIVHDTDFAAASANPQGRLGVTYCTPESLNRLRHASPDAAGRLWVQAHNRSLQALNQLENRIQQVLNQAGCRIPM